MPNIPTPASPPLISVADFAARCGVTPLTIRRRIADGTLTAFRLGPRVIRLDPAQLDRLLVAIPTAAAQ